MGLIIDQPMKKRLWFAYFCLLLCWAVEAYAELGHLARSGQLFAVSIKGRPYVSDFVQIYSLAGLAEQSARRQTRIYDDIAQTDSIKRIVAPVVPELPFTVQYPPYFLALIRPLSAFDLPGAWLVFCLVGVVLLAVSLPWLIANHLEGRFARNFAWVAVLAAFPTWICFKAGGSALLLLPGPVALWCLLRLRKFFWAGLASGLCLFKFQFAPLLLLSGLILGRGRYLTGLLVIAAVLLAGSLLVFGFSNVLAYPGELLHGEASRSLATINPQAMQNFRGALVLLAGADSRLIKTASVVVLAMVAAAVGWLWCSASKQIERGDTRTFDLCASITTVGMLIASPHTHAGDYLAAAIPCIWLWPMVRPNPATDALEEPSVNVASGEQSMVSPAAIRISLAILIVSFPAVSWLLFFSEPFWQLIRIQPFLVWGLLVVALAARLLRLERNVRT